MSRTKPTLWRLSVAAVAGLLSLPLFAAEEDANSREYAMEHKFELAQTYYGECKHTESAEFDAIRPYMKAFTDVEVMAQTLADPVKTANLMRVVSDPRSMHVMMKCSTEPVMWDTWMRGMTDLGKMFNASLVFMNPMTYVNWMSAPFQPGVYTAAFGMISPDNIGRWGSALINPSFYEPMYEPLVNPSWFVPRLNWIVDGESWQPVVDLLKTLYAPVDNLVSPQASDS